MYAPQRFNAFLFAALLAGLATLVAFNAFVDPFGLIRRGGAVRGIDTAKPLINEHPRMTKTAVACRDRPSLVILGTSRSQHALDPQQPAFAGRGYRAFNLAFPGASIYEVRRAFENQVACGGLEAAMIELDFYSFDVHRNVAPDFEDDLLRRERGEWLRPAMRLLRLMSSLDMTRASIATLREPAANLEVEADGRENDHWFEHKVVLLGGIHAAFLKSERTQYIEPFMERAPERRPTFHTRGGDANTADLNAIIELARREHVELHFFFAPMHARQLELFRALGLGPELEDWKQTVAQVVLDAAQVADQPQLTLWDFGGYNVVTMETVPPADDSAARMVGYWESSHFRKEIGDRIIGRMFASAPGEVSDFGVRLDRESLTAVLAQEQRDAVSYRASHRADLEEIAAAISAARTATR